MLQQHGEETLNGAEQCTVNHHRTLVGAIGSDVLQAETFREVEVKLDGGHLPRTADGIASLHGDLRTIEGCAAWIVNQFKSGFLGDFSQRIGGLFPDFVGADVLVRILGGQLQIEVVQTKVLQQTKHEGQQVLQLVLHLLAGAVDVGIVLSQAAHTSQTMHFAGLFVAVHRAEFKQTQRQLTVGTLTGFEDQIVHRAVHRLQVVVEALLDDVAVLILFLVQTHCRIHAILVPMQVAGSLIQTALGDVRSLHEAVVVLAMHFAGVILHRVDHSGALRMEHSQARTDLVREGEQIHFRAELAVVTLGGLLKASLICLEVLLSGESRAIDALQHRIGFASAPVCGCRTLDLERLDIASVRQVRSAAQILPHHIAVTVDVVIEAQFLATDFGGGFWIEVGFLVFDEFNLVRLIGLFCQSLLFGHHAAAEGLGGLDNALHALFDLFKIVRSERSLDIEIVIETVFDDRTDAELGIRTDLLHGLCHNVGCGVTHDGQAIFAVQCNRFHDVAVAQFGIQVAGFAVKTHRDDILVFREELDASLICCHLLRFAVECNGDGLFSHELSFAIGVRGTNVQAWTVCQR